ncbi:DUF302 domain-containing protein [uncultured Tateyamaria sp.]|uniref:DUF302 domain-containing protein n=1 Tax=uncultured Tateyamaria sp. TaxID=455651 RepID=UPI00262A61D6|nr:DUF302 domain-containing protein [uncultured Tateyamaria sp.]
MRAILAALALILTPLTALAEMAPRDGWSVTPTDKGYDQLIADVKSAAKANKMGVVTQAGPTGAAKSRGITIPGNRVIGLFNNVYAVDILNLSTAAMIEAPVRVYVTENADGTATLSYKLPSMVFAPYVQEAGPDLEALAGELDVIFASIAQDAIK